MHYYYGTRVESDWSPGSPLTYFSPGGDVVADGEILAIDEPKWLEITFQARWNAQLEAEGPVRMVWVVGEANGLTTLTVEFYDAPPGTRTYDDFVTGLPVIVSGMKTLLETGRPLARRRRVVSVAARAHRPALANTSLGRSYSIRQQRCDRHRPDSTGDGGMAPATSLTAAKSTSPTRP